MERIDRLELTRDYRGFSTYTLHRFDGGCESFCISDEMWFEIWKRQFEPIEREREMLRKLVIEVERRAKKELAEYRTHEDRAREAFEVLLAISDMIYKEFHVRCSDDAKAENSRDGYEDDENDLNNNLDMVAGHDVELDGFGAVEAVSPAGDEPRDVPLDPEHGEMASTPIDEFYAPTPNGGAVVQDAADVNDARHE
jgi:hypothetical protein